MQHKNRPVNLNLMSIKFPLPAIVSILHRISGLLLFLLIPFALWCFELSLTSKEYFDQIHYFTFGFFHGFFCWVLLSALVYHAIAGVRHLLMDIGIGETKIGGNISAKVVFGLSLVLIVLLGWWILL